MSRTGPEAGDGRFGESEGVRGSSSMGKSFEKCSQSTERSLDFPLCKNLRNISLA